MEFKDHRQVMPEKEREREDESMKETSEVTVVFM